MGQKFNWPTFAGGLHFVFAAPSHWDVASGCGHLQCHPHIVGNSHKGKAMAEGTRTAEVDEGWRGANKLKMLAIQMYSDVDSKSVDSVQTVKNYVQLFQKKTCYGELKVFLESAP